MCKNIQRLKKIGEESNRHANKNGVDNNLPRFFLILCAEFRLPDRIGFADIAKIEKRRKAEVRAEVHICLQKAGGRHHGWEKQQKSPCRRNIKPDKRRPQNDGCDKTHPPRLFSLFDFRRADIADPGNVFFFHKFLIERFLSFNLLIKTIA